MPLRLDGGHEQTHHHRPSCGRGPRGGHGRRGIRVRQQSRAGPAWTSRPAVRLTDSPVRGPVSTSTTHLCRPGQCTGRGQLQEHNGGLGNVPAGVNVTSLSRDSDQASASLSVAWTVATGTAWLIRWRSICSATTNGSGLSLPEVGTRPERQGEAGRNLDLRRSREGPGPKRGAHHVGGQDLRGRDRPGASVRTDRRAGEAGQRTCRFSGHHAHRSQDRPLHEGRSPSSHSARPPSRASCRSWMLSSG
jgi:hypothetical protein